MKRLNSLTLAASLHHASREAPDLFLVAHDPDLQREWMDQLQTLLRQAADRIERSEMRTRELRLFRVRAKLDEANESSWKNLETINGILQVPISGLPHAVEIDESVRQAAHRHYELITKRAATLDAREKRVSRIAKEWGLT